MAVIAPAIGWLIPGAGHFVQKRWIRGLLLLVSIASLFVLGLLMQGHIYKPNGGDILDILGFVGDLGAGGMYIVTLAMNGGQGAIAFAVADYGTKFMIVAGLLNFIAVADAYHIAMGKKQ
jgi:ABC-type Fe3+-siderophore transport system permease subunit